MSTHRSPGGARRGRRGAPRRRAWWEARPPRGAQMALLAALGTALLGVLLGVPAGAAGVLAQAATPTATATQPDCATVTGNLVQDCGFELPVGLQHLGGNRGFPDASRGPWFTGPTGAEIDTQAQFAPNSGAQSLDLNAGVPGGIFQDVPTQPGRGYAVSFALAGNPCTDPPFVKTLTVTFGGVTQSFQFDTTGRSRTQMGWTATTLGTALPAAAGADVTRLAFTSTTSGSCGPLLDDVLVLDVPPTATPTATSTATPTP